MRAPDGSGNSRKRDSRIRRRAEYHQCVRWISAISV
jgi:hypothetical protein